MRHPQGLVNRIYAELLQLTKKIKNKPSSSKLDKSLEQTHHKRRNQDGQSVWDKYKLKNVISLAHLCLTVPGDRDNMGDIDLWAHWRKHKSAQPLGKKCLESACKYWEKRIP